MFIFSLFIHTIFEGSVQKIEKNNYLTKNDVNDQKKANWHKIWWHFKSSVSRICQFTLRFSFFLSINKMIELHTSVKKRNNPSLIFCNPCLYLLSRQKIEWKINILITFHSSLMFTTRLQISQDYSHFSEKFNYYVKFTIRLLRTHVYHYRHTNYREIQ